MDRQIIVDDLLTYYSVDELNEKLGCDINLVSDDSLNTFFNNHCKEHSVKVSIKELYDKYYDSEFLINTLDEFYKKNEKYYSSNFIFSLSFKLNIFKINFCY